MVPHPHELTQKPPFGDTPAGAFRRLGDVNLSSMVSMVLDPDDPRPPYIQIIEDLSAKIASGEYPPGSKLPSRAALVAQYGVASATIQNALTRLKERGVIVGRQGQGVFVRTKQP